jgi:transposase
MIMVTYDIEFKKEAVKMASQLGAVKAARDLDVPVNTLYSWINKAKSAGNFSNSTDKGKTNSANETVQLVKRIKELEKANHILQEALRFFAVSQK